MLGWVQLSKYKAQARERLLSEAEWIYRKKRSTDMDAVIGNLKLPVMAEQPRKAD